jgi:hypothetical protein
VLEEAGGGCRSWTSALLLLAEKVGSLVRMGAALSTSFGTPSAKQTQQILNTILREMFSRADLVDLYSLADSERCKNYLVFTSKAFDKLFFQINLQPKMGKDGVFFFRRLEGIQRANPDWAMQAESCEHLAFFFIRIFQIFAALTISSLDSTLPDFDPIEYVASSSQQSQAAYYAMPPTLKGFAPQRTQRSWTLAGGGRSILGESSSNYTLITLPPPYDLLLQMLTKLNSDELGSKFPGGALVEGADYPEDKLYFKDYQEQNAITMYIPLKSIFESIKFSKVSGSSSLRFQATQKTSMPEYIPVIYIRKEAGNRYELKGEIKITQQSDLLSYEVKVKLNERLTDTFTLVKSYDADLTPKTGQPKGYTLDKALAATFNEALFKLGILKFNPILFLEKKFHYISSLTEENPTIKGTKVSLRGKGESYLRSDDVDLAYKDTIMYHKKSTNIEIRIPLQVKRVTQSSSDAPVQYVISMDVNRIITKPVELKDDLNVPEGVSERIFETSAADTDPPMTKTRDGRKISFPDYLTARFDQMLKPIRASKEGEVVRGGIQFSREGLPKPYNSDGIKEGLRIKKIWEALARKPPMKAHCIARALQLLNVDAIKGISTGRAPYSSVCRVRFPYIEDKTLPKPGQSVTDTMGIYALSKLFADEVIPKAAPKVSNSAAYRDYAKKLKLFFEKYRSEDQYATLGQTDVPNRLSNIKEMGVKELCEGHQKDILMVEDKSTLSSLQSKARQLISIQGTHLRNVMRIMFKLFNEQKIRSGVLEMHPALLTGGMEYINKVSVEARELLINYYGQCEKTYTEGVYVLYDALRDGKKMSFVPREYGRPPPLESQRPQSAPAGPGEQPAAPPPNRAPRLLEQRPANQNENEV